MKKINMSKLQKRMGKTISTKEALKDVVPMQWDEDVFNELIEFINNSDFVIEQITDNL